MFQSTHSLRSATLLDSLSDDIKRVSIHALLAECDTVPAFCPSSCSRFNPRTPCGVRHLLDLNCKCSTWFQSTHSLRSATLPIHPSSTRPEFQSTHSLRSATEYPVTTRSGFPGFNPRTPCGVRRNRLYTLLLNRANHTLRQPP